MAAGAPQAVAEQQACPPPPLPQLALALPQTTTAETQHSRYFWYR